MKAISIWYIYFLYLANLFFVCVSYCLLVPWKSWFQIKTVNNIECCQYHNIETINQVCCRLKLITKVYLKLGFGASDCNRCFYTKLVFMIDRLIVDLSQCCHLSILWDIRLNVYIRDNSGRSFKEQTD